MEVIMNKTESVAARLGYIMKQRGLDVYKRQAQYPAAITANALSWESERKRYFLSVDTDSVFIYCSKNNLFISTSCSCFSKEKAPFRMQNLNMESDSLHNYLLFTVVTSVLT